MLFCDDCGQEIIIRWAHGRPVKHHLYGSCGDHFDIRDHYRSQASDSNCRPTTCPVCKESVFFIKHNGGSVYVDPPLGPPWPKHGCFLYDGPGRQTRTVLEDSYLGDAPGDGLLLGIVKRTEIHPRWTDTILHVQLLDGTEMQIKVEGAAEIAGEMVIIDPSKNQVRFWKGHGTYRII